MDEAPRREFRTIRTPWDVEKILLIPNGESRVSRNLTLTWQGEHAAFLGSLRRAYERGSLA